MTPAIAAVVAMYGAFMLVGWIASRKVREGTPASSGDLVSIARATQAELVIIAVPFSATRELLPGLATVLEGKIVVDATKG